MTSEQYPYLHTCIHTRIHSYTGQTHAIKKFTVISVTRIQAWQELPRLGHDHVPRTVVGFYLLPI